MGYGAIARLSALSPNYVCYCNIRSESKILQKKICDKLLGNNMKFSNYLLATGACLEYLVPLAKATNVSISYNSAAQDATAFAIQYAYPISQWQKAVRNILDAVKTPNTLWPYHSLSGPRNRTIVGPNADTLYIWAAIDLSHEDLVLTIPNISDGRNWIWPFYDLFGNNFAGISINTNSPPGDYLIRRADDALVQPGIRYTTPAELSAYKGVISYATTYGILLGRILVRQNTTSDITTIRNYQDQTFLKTVPRILSQPFAAQAPRLSRELIDTSNAPNRVIGYLDLLAKIGQSIQPDVYADRRSLYPTAWRQSNRCHAANASISAAYYRNLLDVGNNWVIPKVICQGIFGIEYGCRAYRALHGYLGLVQSENLFITNKSDNVTLGENSTFLFTFFGKPPIKSTGFWSLTVYGADQYLVPNELGRYVIGDRSTQLKFESGGLVYGNDSNAGKGTEDGRFQVLLQPANIRPPDSWTSKYYVVLRVKEIHDATSPLTAPPKIVPYLPRSYSNFVVSLRGALFRNRVPTTSCSRRARITDAPIEVNARPLEYPKFNAFPHGGQVAKQDCRMPEDVLSEGEKCGRKMPALREMVKRASELG
ncbi:hypothetical protein COCMIDRAFT_21406 [Bipolaris oryzae ATCC 44560]|uniref:DUF1254 domain-containing protein n=1 Tax=Bipolaris oryzae ATCC 44560 TaxID=930090 RepID=W6ZM04_COCMI|nr:uncharacterized protein COCMIDRAFT_21406 [Bipolaris oryzae ATCC 44560]EUC51003.1 hypothetical protein COCMIDRAFT_21406 [Bipolaris oryzae ATCC 44560]